MTTTTSGTIRETSFLLPGQTSFYRGKVRDVYVVDDEWLIMVATDRISAFDYILPKPVPFKGQVLNQMASKFLEESSHIAPNWLISSPDPNVAIGHMADPYPVEMVIRGYLSGHAWREYREGKRDICGVPLPEGLHENDQLPEPIITPTTKAHEGHDMDISKADILEQGLVAEKEYVQMEDYTKRLYQEGAKRAEEHGLILADTKYEFGKSNGQVLLIDEVHTPDSSRYFYLDGYQERQERGEKQQQLSKEFVRQWLIEQGFQGQDEQEMPELPDDFIQSVSNRYIDLYEKLTGEPFQPRDTTDIQEAIEESVKNELTRLKADLKQ